MRHYDSQYRAHLAAIIAAGLIATHGVDHGGVEPEVIADKAVAIADAIVAKTEPNEVSTEQPTRGESDPSLVDGNEPPASKEPEPAEVIEMPTPTPPAPAAAEVVEEPAQPE